MKLKDWFNILPEQFTEELDCEVFGANFGLTLKNNLGDIILKSSQYKKHEELIPNTLTRRIK